MVYFRRKDGSVFRKLNPDKKMLSTLKKIGYVPCDENGKTKKTVNKKEK